MSTDEVRSTEAQTKACHILDCTQTATYRLSFLPDPATYGPLEVCLRHAYDQDAAHPNDAYLQERLDGSHLDFLATDRLLVETGSEDLAEAMRAVNCTCGHGPEPADIHGEG